MIDWHNLICMALAKCGGPGSEGFRHINIHYFWVAKHLTAGEAIVEHRGMDLMFANALTNPFKESS